MVRRSGSSGVEQQMGRGMEVVGQEEEGEMEAASHSSLHFHPRRTSSKYDFVKVRVWLGDHADHYYVLSRFLLSRMLTVTKIPNHVAIKISLELKKLLIDNSLLDVSQSDLEANLFKLMERRGYGEEYINRYKMMTRFHHQRVPLVILVCGTACVGKSTIATQLAQCLNLPNVLQVCMNYHTDMVYELLRSSTDAPLTSIPIWEREFSSSEELVSEFRRECHIVRKGLDGDLKKAMKDGKPIIIEGIHLDPSIYLMDEQNGGTHSDFDGTAAIASSTEPVETGRDLTDTEKTTSGVASTPTLNGYPESCKVHSCLTISSMRQEGPANAEAHQNPDHENSDRHMTLDNDHSDVNTARSSVKAIIVPIVLRMDEFDHMTLLEEWITCRSSNTVLTTEGQQNLFHNLMTIQDYLCSFRSPGATIVTISATTFPQTLDWLHSHLLQRIEDGFICQ